MTNLTEPKSGFLITQNPPRILLNSTPTKHPRQNLVHRDTTQTQYSPHPAQETDFQSLSTTKKTSSALYHQETGPTSLKGSPGKHRSCSGCSTQLISCLGSSSSTAICKSPSSKNRRACHTKDPGVSDSNLTRSRLPGSHASPTCPWRTSGDANGSR